jgi:two-component system sensor histidine kinase TctE
MATNLRRQLLSWIVVPAIGAIAMDMAVIYQSAADTAAQVQDRLLLGSARMMAEQIRFEDGLFQHVIPPAALELFQAEDQDRIYFSVAIVNGADGSTGTTDTAGAVGGLGPSGLWGEGGSLLAGYPDMPMPAATADSPAFFDATMRSNPVRVVSLLQTVIGTPQTSVARVTVAETVNARRNLTHKLWLQSVIPQLIILFFAVGLIWLALDRGLRPMRVLRERIQSRQPGALEPVVVPHLSAELQALVDALNDYIRRLHAHVDTHAVFIQNAAHQLRTPFALLNTQLNYATRNTDPVERRESLDAAQKTLRSATRLVNQLLALSSAHAFETEPIPQTERDTPCALHAIAQEVLEALAMQAQARQIDLGAEWSDAMIAVAARPVVLREMLMNIVDNAIRYTQPGGRVTVRIQTSAQAAQVSVSDNGPGIPPALRERVFERFFRINDRDSQGSGLGLAIVREYALRLGAQVQLSNGEGGQGLCVTLHLPLHLPRFPVVDAREAGGD